VALHDDELRLPITVLKLIAIGINPIPFETLARGAHCVLCSDSLNSVQMLTNPRAKSSLMAHVHFLILGLPEAKSLGCVTSTVHCFGSAKPAADAVSRGNMKYFFFALCAQLKVQPTKLQLPAAARALLDDTVKFARAQGSLEPPSSHANRTAAQLTHERHFGNDYSSDEHGDEPWILNTDLKRAAEVKEIPFPKWSRTNALPPE
jgi:hypothetical protein